MKLVRALVLAAALVGSAPLLAQDLTPSGVKAFIASIDAAISRRDVDVIVDHIAEHAVVSATVLMQGQTQTLRMNKLQYRQMLALAWSAASSYEYERSNEKISIDGNQATVTADVAESMVIQGQPFATKARERATVESLDGKLMLTQLVVNQVL
jgi:ketosteroid isomerase-like protein